MSQRTRAIAIALLAAGCGSSAPSTPRAPRAEAPRPPPATSTPEQASTPPAEAPPAEAPPEAPPPLPPCVAIEDAELEAIDTVAIGRAGRPVTIHYGVRLANGDRLVFAGIGVTPAESRRIAAADRRRADQCENADETRSRRLGCERLDWGTACNQPTEEVVARFPSRGRVTVTRLFDGTCPNPYNEESVGEDQATSIVECVRHDVDDDGHDEIIVTHAWTTPNARAVGPSNVTSMHVLDDTGAIELALRMSFNIGSFQTTRTVEHVDLDGDGHRDVRSTVVEAVCDDVNDTVPPLTGDPAQLQRQVEAGEIEAARILTFTQRYDPTTDRYEAEVSAGPDVFRPCN